MKKDKLNPKVIRETAKNYGLTIPGDRTLFEIACNDIRWELNRHRSLLDDLVQAKRVFENSIERVELLINRLERSLDERGST